MCEPFLSETPAAFRSKKVRTLSLIAHHNEFVKFFEVENSLGSPRLTAGLAKNEAKKS